MIRPNICHNMHVKILFIIIVPVMSVCVCYPRFTVKSLEPMKYFHLMYVRYDLLSFVLVMSVYVCCERIALNFYHSLYLVR